MIDRISIFARLNECQKIIWHAAARFAAILLHLLVEQSDVLCSCHFDNGAFPDGAAPVVNPSGFLVGANDLPGKILNTDGAVLPLGHRQVAAMHRSQPARRRDAEFFADQESVVLGEFRICAVPHVGSTLGIDKQRTEGWGIYGKSNAIVRQLGDNINTISVYGLPIIPDGRIQAADIHGSNLALCLG